MQFDRKQLSNEELILFYQKLLWPRMVEEKMLVLLRQGRISKWFSGIGQEAIAVALPWQCKRTNGSCPCIAILAYSLPAICH